jgi:hypothetical protein
MDGFFENPQWANATFLDFNFTFVNEESYKANVYLGHNATHFFVGAKIFAVGPNPFSVPNRVIRPDGFIINFDVDNDEKLTCPEDRKGLISFTGIYDGRIYWSSSTVFDEFWDTLGYPNTEYWRNRRPETMGDIEWTDDRSMYITYHKTYDVSTHGCGNYSGGIKGDEYFEFCFPLVTNDTLADGLQLKFSQTYTLGFALEFYRQAYDLENGTRVPDLYDYWPGEGFSPELINNASKYAKMLIDLRQGISPLPWIVSGSIIAIVALTAVLAIYVSRRKRHISKSMG